jgi:hypothetical protein
MNSTATGAAALLAMARTRPLRTCIYTVLPVVAAVAQLGNGYYHGVPLRYVGAFAVCLCVLSAVITRHHLADFRLETLNDRWLSRSREE